MSGVTPARRVSFQTPANLVIAPWRAAVSSDVADKNGWNENAAACRIATGGGGTGAGRLLCTTMAIIISPNSAQSSQAAPLSHGMFLGMYIGTRTTDDYDGG